MHSLIVQQTYFNGYAHHFIDPYHKLLTFVYDFRLIQQCILYSIACRFLWNLVEKKKKIKKSFFFFLHKISCAFMCKVKFNVKLLSTEYLCTYKHFPILFIACRYIYHIQNWHFINNFTADYTTFVQTYFVCMKM